MTSAIPVQCSTNWAVKPTGSWSRNIPVDIPLDGEEYLTIVPQARVGYDMVDSQRGA